MKTQEQIEKRISELKNNKFYRYDCGGPYKKGNSAWREIHSAITELEWVLKEDD